MEIKNHSLESEKSMISYSGVLMSFQKYFHEKTEGLNLFEIVMLTLYSLMTVFFLLTAIYFVLTKGFKF